MGTVEKGTWDFIPHEFLSARGRRRRLAESRSLDKQLISLLSLLTPYILPCADLAI